MKIYIAKIAPVLALVFSTFCAAYAAGESVAQTYVEIDGVSYLKDADGNLRKIEIEKPSVPEERRMRPARGLRSGMPHASTWRVDEEYAAQAKAADANTASAPQKTSEAAAVSATVIAPKKYSVAVEIYSVDGGNKKVAAAVFDNLEPESSAPFVKKISDGIVLVSMPKKISENSFAVELSFGFSVSARSEIANSDDVLKAYISRTFEVPAGENATFKLVSFPCANGVLEYEAVVKIIE